MNDDEILTQMAITGGGAIGTLKGFRQFGYVPEHHRATVDELIATWDKLTEQISQKVNP